MDIVERIDRFFLPKLEKIPVVSMYAKTRGWPFVIAWAHRITGVLMVLYIFFHIYTLTLLKSPESYNAKMQVLQVFIFVFLEWLLAIPVIFHALNGGRLLLYEAFEQRNTATMIRWTLGLAAGFTLFMGLMMIMGNQIVTPLFFWLTALCIASGVVYRLMVRIRTSGASLGWKLQRVTGGYLLIMVPAHLLFMHLNPTMGHDAAVVIDRMQSVFIKLVDLSLVAGVLYHGGYGLVSIAKDYLSSNQLRFAAGCVIVLVTGLFGWIGMKLTISL